MPRPQRRNYDPIELWGLAQNRTRSQLAAHYGVTLNTIRNWCRREGITPVDGRRAGALRRWEGKVPARKLILHHRRNGRSYAWIGDHFGVTEERARQWVEGPWPARDNPRNR